MKIAALGRLAIALGLVAGVARPLAASNQHDVVQTVESPCSRYGGGTVLAISPDGSHVYEGTHDYATPFGGMLFVSSRTAISGALTLVQTIDGLETRPTEIALSPDGAHVYLGVSSTVRIYARDAGTGTLALVDVIPQSAATSLAVSPDGATVYVLSGGLRVYSRDSLTGLLTLVETQSTPSALDVVVAPDGAHVYVFRITSAFGGQAIEIYARNLVTGALTHAGSVPGVGNARTLAVSADGMNLYAAVAGSTSRVAVFDRDAGTGALTLIDTEAATDPGLSELVGASVIAFSPDGAQVYVGATNASSSSVAAIHGDVAGSALFVFSRSAVDGALTLVASYQDETGGVTDGLRGISEVAPSPDGAHVYTVGEGTVVFTRSNVDGTLTFVSSNEAEGGGHAVVISPDDLHVYRLCDRAIAVLERVGSAGTLTPVGVHSFGAAVDRARTLAISPDGEHVYVLELRNGLHDDWPFNGQLLVFDRDAGTGALSPIAAYPEAGSGFVWTDEMVVSPDGVNVYLVADETLLVYSRDDTTGLLTLLETQQDGGVVTGMEFAWSVAVSPGGEHVYVGAAGIVAFDRHPVTGALTFQSHLPSGGGSGGPLVPANDVVLSPDGTSLYGFDASPGVMAAYARDLLTGDLSFESAVHGGTSFNEPGFVAPFGFAVNPNGAYLYLAARELLDPLGPQEPVFYGFRRDGETGALKQVQLLPGLVDVDPFGNPIGASGEVWALDAAGRDLYVPKRSGNVVLLVRQDACGAIPLAGCEPADTSTLKVLAKPGPKDVVSWKWKGTAPLAAGDPTATTGFTLCLYDGSASPQPLVSNEVAPGGTCGTKPCWSAPVSGFKYGNKDGAPDGVTKLKLTTAAPGRVVVKGKGGGLPPLGLPYASPVTVQLHATNGECWEAVYAAPVLSDPTQYKATQ